MKLLTICSGALNGEAILKPFMMIKLTKLQVMFSVLIVLGLAIGAENSATAGEIFGTKFNDLDGNGIYDSFEPGQEGWIIYLDLNNNGQYDITEPNAITDSNGNYEFVDLTADIYTVAEVNQTGWIQTLPGWAGGRLFTIYNDDTTWITYISELDPCDGSLLNTFPGPTQAYGNLIGLAVGPTSLFYINVHGINSSEIWELDTETGSVIDNDFVDLGTGYYPISMAYLDGKIYIAKYKQGMTQSEFLVWNPSNDSIVNTITVTELVGDGLTGAADLGVLFATYSFNKIVKIDPNSGEILQTIDRQVLLAYGLSYIDGVLIISSSSTAYRLDPNSGATLGTFDLPVPGDGLGLGGDGIPSQMYKVNLEANESINLDFGNAELNSAGINGTKWNDLNANGVRDQNEQGLSGWKIYIDANENDMWDEGEVYDLTDSNGSYEFVGLAAGTLVVAEVNQADWQQTFPGGNGKHSLVVNVGRTAEDIDFGNAFVLSSRIKGIAWNDLDANGLQDQGESVLAGWVVYLDLNNNGRFDGSELSTLTDANGMYEFTGIAPGSYPVAIVGRCNWRATSPLISKQGLVEISNPRDLAYDYQRNLLYISTSDGNIERYDLLARTLLTPFSVGTYLNGMDITSDYNFLYVTEDDTSGNFYRLHKVNLSNAAVTDITYYPGYRSREGGGWDIKIGCCGKGLMTAQFNGSGSVPLRELDLSTDTLTVRTDIPGGVLDKIGQNTRVFRSADRKFLMLPDKSFSDIYTYDAVADTFTAEAKLAYFLALNRDASLVAQSTSSLIIIYNRVFSHVIEIPTDNSAGIAFDSAKNVFYYADSEFNQLAAVETRLWKELDRINISEGIDRSPPSYDTFENGVMASSEDGRFLALTKSSGVYVFNVDGSQIIDVGLCETVDNVDFGQQRHKTGDFDGDRDVDMQDIKTLNEQWLLEKLSADIAPYCPDGIINFLDWAVFAKAWQSTSDPSSENWNPKCDIAPDGGDGIVDIDDLTVFVNQWLQLSALCVDIAPIYDGDGIVNMLDFSALAENWLWEE